MAILSQLIGIFPAKNKDRHRCCRLKKTMFMFSLTFDSPQDGGDMSVLNSCSFCLRVSPISKCEWASWILTFSNQSFWSCLESVSQKVLVRIQRQQTQINMTFKETAIVCGEGVYLRLRLCLLCSCRQTHRPHPWSSSAGSSVWLWQRAAAVLPQSYFMSLCVNHFLLETEVTIKAFLAQLFN